MFLVGITGGIASGKSTVSSIFREYGVKVIDADVLARQVVEPGKKAWKKIKNEFGPSIIGESGEVDRQALGQIIFSDREKRRRLDAITHPEIYKLIFWIVFKCFLKGHQFVILDLPLLFESGAMVDYIYKVIVVTCDEEQQLLRLIERNSLCKEDGVKRIKAQMPLEEKCKRAHFVIDNSKSEAELRAQVEDVYRVLRHSRYHWRLRLMIIGWLITVALTALWLGGYFNSD